MKKLYHKIDSISDHVITLKATNVTKGDLARVHKKSGAVVAAQVTAISGHDVSLQIFEGSKDINADDQIEFLGHALQVNFAKDHLPGRILNALCEPIDGRPPLPQSAKISIYDSSLSSLKRKTPSKVIPIDLPMIDTVNPLLEGQTLIITCASTTPLATRIARNAAADILILGIMGATKDDLLHIKQELRSRLHQTVIFAHTDLNSAGLCVPIPDVALATAEQYALLGARVLVLLADMCAYLDALAYLNSAPIYTSFNDKAIDIDGAGSITLITLETPPSPTSAQRKSSVRRLVLEPTEPVIL